MTKSNFVGGPNLTLSAVNDDQTRRLLTLMRTALDHPQTAQLALSTPKTLSEFMRTLNAAEQCLSLEDLRLWLYLLMNQHHCLALQKREVSLNVCDDRLQSANWRLISAFVLDALLTQEDGQYFTLPNLAARHALIIKDLYVGPGAISIESVVEMPINFLRCCVNAIPFSNPYISAQTAFFEASREFLSREFEGSQAETEGFVDFPVYAGQPKTYFISQCKSAWNLTAGSNNNCGIVCMAMISKYYRKAPHEELNGDGQTLIDWICASFSMKNVALNDLQFAALLRMLALSVKRIYSFDQLDGAIRAQKIVSWPATHLEKVVTYLKMVVMAINLSVKT